MLVHGFKQTVAMGARVGRKYHRRLEERRESAREITDGAAGFREDEARGGIVPGQQTHLEVEFGETGRQALVREIKEELGLESSTGAFLGVVENSFLQHGKPHAEINLVYQLAIPEGAVKAREDWIEFEWRPLCDLGDLLPEAFRKLGQDTTARFEP